MNKQLKISIILADLDQVKIGKRCGIGELRMSQIIRQRTKPTDDEKSAIAKALGVKVSEVFPEGDLGR